ncbi:MAG: formylglycine-generating enzyme family protein [Anaerolineae bacterium]|nr:formylglycine-generating enzyme family protein [Anaerolineae bacterium]
MIEDPIISSDTPAASIIVWPDDGKDMVFIEGGVCIMGSSEGNPNYRPEHQVEVASFYIDAWPVTNAEYRQFVEATGHPVPNYDVSWCDTQGYNWDPETRMYPEGKAHHPVVLVTWEDAMAYAAWAHKRLPTEAEWECAARGLSGRRYPWGNEFEPGYCCNCKESGLGGTSPIGHFSPQGDTPEGLVDMVGNVWEWTNSLYWPYPYNPDDGRESREAMGFRVLRGASWVNDANIVHCLSRLDGDFIFYTNVGFRCAVSPE